MKLAESPTRFGQHQNAFGFLRLLFASLVIVSHVPEIVDSGPRREILHQLTGNVTFGGFAVWGFFIISGYLITGSMLNSYSIASYLKKRILRIYPGFLVASLVCLLIVAPISGGALRGGFSHGLLTGIVRMGVLARPVSDHAFYGQNFNDAGTALNGAMWTIQYEFACYAMIALIFSLGIMRHRWVIPLLSVVMITMGTFGNGVLPSWMSRDILFPASPNQIFLLTGIFLSGSTYYLYQKYIKISLLNIIVSSTFLMFCLCNPYTASYGYAIFGSYLIFASAKYASGTWIGNINDKNDISYGVYLYAWPAQQLLIRYIGSHSLILLGLLTWLCAAGAGWLSWKFVERPVLELTRRRRTAN